MRKLGPFVDLTGQRFGSLAALSYVGFSIWQARCDCGVMIAVLGKHLRNGHTTRCLVCRYRDVPPMHKLEGHRFGRLVVKRYAGDSTWIVQCDCGNERRVGTTKLLHARWRSCGCWRVGPRTASPPPPVEGAKWIPLTRGKFALVDEGDYERLTEHHWSAVKSGHVWYASRTLSGGRSIKMHKEIMGVSHGVSIDHRNGDGLNNRRSNLRTATVSQQLMNTRPRRGKKYSSFKGVTRSSRGEWVAQIKVNGRGIRVPARSELEAAGIYDLLAGGYFGEFARPNFSVQGAVL